MHSPELDVETWELNTYLKPGDDTTPPSVIPFASIIGQISRATIDSSEPVMWITISNDRVRVLILQFGKTSLIYMIYCPATDSSNITIMQVSLSPFQSFCLGCERSDKSILSTPVSIPPSQFAYKSASVSSPSPSISAPSLSPSGFFDVANPSKSP